MTMSSKRAGARAGRALTIALLRFILQGKSFTLGTSSTFAAYSQKQVARRLYEARRLGYFEEKSNQYTLTKKGMHLLNEDTIWNLEIPTPAKWDGKWHAVLFDIPTRRKKYRDVLRLRLKELGLVLYQDSVWVYPYPLEETIGKVADFYMLSANISFATIEKLTGEEKLRETFNLR